MIINSFALLPTMQLRSSKRVSDLLLSCFIINYSFFKTSFIQKSENDMTWVIYLAFFTSSRYAENVARGLESLLK